MDFVKWSMGRVSLPLVTAMNQQDGKCHLLASIKIKSDLAFENWLSNVQTVPLCSTDKGGGLGVNVRAADFSIPRAM